jgi:hypothetical protein
VNSTPKNNVENSCLPSSRYALVQVRFCIQINLPMVWQIRQEVKWNLWVNGTKYLATSENQNADLSFVFEVIKSNTTIPLVLTDGDGTNETGFTGLPGGKRVA